MSFASEIKNELCKTMPRDSCCLKAECYGLLLFGKNFNRQAVSFTTESAPTARRAAQLAAQVLGVMAETRFSVSRRTGEKTVVTLSVSGEDQRKQVLSAFGYTGHEVSLRLNRGVLENGCCPTAFLRGAFLCCGTATNPEKDYHLEFLVPFMNLAKDLAALLNERELDLQATVMQRKGAYVVYVKGGERVADLLTFLGAGQASMELMQAKMLKELRNNINRKTNFETANLDKTVNAATRQRHAIQRILDMGGISLLPEELQELAMLRWRNPEMTLRDLEEALTEPLSRSGINHRLARIVEISDQLPAPLDGL